MRLTRLCIALLAAGSVWASQPADQPSWRQEGELWIAGNASMEIGISKSRGTIERLVDKLSKEDYCEQVISASALAGDAALQKGFRIGHRIGGLTLIDELKGTEFSDLKQRSKIANLQAAASGGAASLSFQKLFPGADFVVTETFRLDRDHLRWDVRIRKAQGADRTLRVIQFAPLPLGQYKGWAPIAEAPFEVKPYAPFAIEYGQSTAGAVGESHWRTNIPLMVFYSLAKKRSVSFTVPFEIPSVRVRFLNNTGAAADFHWNSRNYPPAERPYLQVSSEYLGLREKKDLETGLLISMHQADWRPALGWVYSKYRQYFDPDPAFKPWEGSFVLGYDLMKNSYREDELRGIYAGRKERGARWEELHGHFPWYGLMIPGAGVRSWTCESHPTPDTTMTREKIAAHTRLTKQFGIGTFLYYNITEATHWYAQKEFPESVARDESGERIGAYRGDEYPGRRACWLMNADPSSAFGKHMARQAEEMVGAYPDAAGFFWDVFGRGYLFDFAHDDGITMVNNKPAYYLEFMFQRMMREHVRPLLRARGMTLTANKPVTISSCEGLDGIMAMEEASEEEDPGWIAAQSYLGLNRYVMIFERTAANAELMFLECLRYGMLPSDPATVDEPNKPLPPARLAALAELGRRYQPFMERLAGKKWIFYPEALELPKNTDGNIFRLRDGSVMITMVSTWRNLRKAEGVARNLEVICRLPDAGSMKYVSAHAIDLGSTSQVEAVRNGDTLRLRVPQHGKATVILLSARPEQALEGK